MMQFFNKFQKFLYRKKPEIPYAGVTDRLIAASIDLLVLYMVVIPLSTYIYISTYPDGNAFAAAMAITAQENPELTKSGSSTQLFVVASKTHPELIQAGVKQFFFNSFLQIFLIGIFIVTFIKLKGTTPGKYFVGIKVVDSITGGGISWWQSIIRYLAYIPSCAVLMIGIFWAGFNERKRMWHDYFGDTVVIYDPDRWYKKVFEKIKFWIFGKPKK